MVVTDVSIRCPVSGAHNRMGLLSAAAVPNRTCAPASGWLRYLDERAARGDAEIYAQLSSRGNSLAQWAPPRTIPGTRTNPWRLAREARADRDKFRRAR